ncbi:hypothetical protein K466DRAFT_12533 [Polyporus arcularius HHB13444]|uniref:Uncharacterized protein n=1 Tax=Polyporus arcularius HHB13444 TaxID=1314778 RepID=A0A5C3NQE5_9APHY|nr:hypothetical protein K466DRAFT_12533 [Polyporus arcularius HHB13444]
MNSPVCDMQQVSRTASRHSSPPTYQRYRRVDACSSHLVSPRKWLSSRHLQDRELPLSVRDLASATSRASRSKAKHAHVLLHNYQTSAEALDWAVAKTKSELLHSEIYHNTYLRARDSEGEPVPQTSRTRPACAACPRSGPGSRTADAEQFGGKLLTSASRSVLSFAVKFVTHGLTKPAAGVLPVMQGRDTSSCSGPSQTDF